MAMLELLQMLGWWTIKSFQLETPIFIIAFNLTPLPLDSYIDDDGRPSIDPLIDVEIT
jgi:hypothetical protein